MIENFRCAKWTFKISKYNWFNVESLAMFVSS